MVLLFLLTYYIDHNPGGRDPVPAKVCITMDSEHRLHFIHRLWLQSPSITPFRTYLEYLHRPVLLSAFPTLLCVTPDSTFVPYPEAPT